MKTLRSVSASSSLAVRRQKIRERMIVEQVSGVPVSDKEVFLSLCLQYEQGCVNPEIFVCNKVCACVGIEHCVCEREDRQANWQKWGDDWGDWFKMISVVDKT